MNVLEKLGLNILFKHHETFALPKLNEDKFETLIVIDCVVEMLHNYKLWSRVNSI